MTRGREEETKLEQYQVIKDVIKSETIKVNQKVSQSAGNSLTSRLALTVTSFFLQNFKALPNVFKNYRRCVFLIDEMHFFSSFLLTELTSQDENILGFMLAFFVYNYYYAWLNTQHWIQEVFMHNAQ